MGEVAGVADGAFEIRFGTSAPKPSRTAPWDGKKLGKSKSCAGLEGLRGAGAGEGAPRRRRWSDGANAEVWSCSINRRRPSFPCPCQSGPGRGPPFEREAKGRCDEILCLDIGVLGQNVVRFLHADAGRFGCLPQANEVDDCDVFVEVLCVAGDVPLVVEVDQVEEVHARVADVVLAFQRSAKSLKPRDVLVAEFGLEVERDFEVDEDGAALLGPAGLCSTCSNVPRRQGPVRCSHWSGREGSR